MFGLSSFFLVLNTHIAPTAIRVGFVFSATGVSRVLMIPVHKSRVAIAAFDPASVLRDLQPDAGVAQRTLATVAGNAIAVHNPDFRRFNGHRLAVLLVVGPAGIR